jgi:hypothetical protein
MRNDSWHGGRHTEHRESGEKDSFWRIGRDLLSFLKLSVKSTDAGLIKAAYQSCGLPFIDASKNSPRLFTPKTFRLNGLAQINAAGRPSKRWDSTARSFRLVDPKNRISVDPESQSTTVTHGSFLPHQFKLKRPYATVTYEDTYYFRFCTRNRHYFDSTLSRFCCGSHFRRLGEIQGFYDSPAAFLFTPFQPLWFSAF